MHHVIWKYVRFQSLPQTQAEQLVSDPTGLEVILVSMPCLLKRALQIGLTHQLAVYDSVYIALAERLQYPLIIPSGKITRVKVPRSMKLLKMVKSLTKFYRYICEGHYDDR